MYQRALLVALVAVACKGTDAAGQGGGQMRSDDALRLPPGFKIAVFAENLQGVRFMTLGPGSSASIQAPAIR